MRYVVNTGDDIQCDKCLCRIGVAKGFYSQFGKILCCNCQELFIKFVKEKYNEFIQAEQSDSKIMKVSGTNPVSADVAHWGFKNDGTPYIYICDNPSSENT